MASKSGHYDYLYKILLVGDSGVGKPDLISRFTGNAKRLGPPTIGVDFVTRSLDIDGKTFKAQVWDTAGQERFRTITSAYYRGAAAVILVYDITNRQTYENMNEWMGEVVKHANDQIVTMLVGNMCDLEHLRAVPTAEAETFAMENNLLFMEASARDNINVEELFRETIKEVHRVRAKEKLTATSKDNNPSAEPVVQLGDRPTKKSNRCQT